MTQAMSFSPYKKPFEGRIVTWENKLRITQVCEGVRLRMRVDGVRCVRVCEVRV